jgi:hypothetical protein
MMETPDRPTGSRRAASGRRQPLKRKSRKKPPPEVVGFLGVGLDGQDGHRRITEIEHFLLVGGSSETHEQMQETAMRFGEALEKRGKQLKDTTPDEAAEILREVRAKNV